MAQLDPVEISLDRGSRAPLGQQLAEAIEARIATGRLAQGDRLPPSRDLAAQLHINRGTVQAAYGELSRRGLVAGRVGSGTVVRGHPASGKDAFDFETLLSRGAAAIVSDAPVPAAAPLVADFSRLTPDERFFPLEDFTRALFEAWSRRSDLWQYAPPLGFAGLRAEIARRLAERGVTRAPEEILVTNGAQQGLDLLFRAFVEPGDSIAVESPGYPGVLALARFAGIELVPLPMTAEGPDPLPLLGRRVKLVYVTPERQNPTGITAGKERRQAIVAAAVAAGALVVEDGYDDAASGLEPLAAQCPDRTIWLGTLSKDLVPGLRIGWLAGPEPIIERLARIKRMADFQTPLPLQAAVAEFLSTRADRSARRRRAFEVETRRIATARALKTHLPEVSWWGGEVGNPLFWLHLPDRLSGRRVAEAAAARGVGVAAGSEFDPAREDLANVRLSVTRVEKREVDRGIAVFAEAVRSVRSASGAHSAPVV